MADLCGTAAVMLIKSENGTHNTVISDEQEHDNVPFKLRMKKRFLGIEDCPESSDINPGTFESVSETKSMSLIDVKKEDQACYSQLLQGILSLPSGCFPDKDKDDTVGQKQNHTVNVIQGVTTEDSEKISADDMCLRDATFIGHDCLPGDCNCQGILSNAYDCPNQTLSTEINTDSFGVEKVNVNVCSLIQNPTLSKMPGKVKVEVLDQNQISLLGEGTSCSAGSDLQVVTIEKGIPDYLVNDDLDHIVLKERQQMLLSRTLLENPESVLEGAFQNNAGREKEESLSVGGEFSVVGSSCITHSCSSSPCDCTETGMNISDNLMGMKENSSEKNSRDLLSLGGQSVVHTNPDDMLSSTLSSFVKVKVEASDSNDLHSIGKDYAKELSFNNMRTVKSELEITDRFYLDELDHMPLQDRIKLLTSGEVSNSVISRKYKCFKNFVPPLESSPVVLESIKPVTIKRLRKRKKTATDSIETAMEEDAPGLLQVLIDKGISVDEIRLYGESESDDALDDSFKDDSFAELEDVISKLFSNRQSLLKFAPIRCTKGSKISYCLACLISLVEQTRYLRFRKWPVEWGWCRDLQSFIFVFERHNRIVLERPEYGYATYFFELIDSLPIDWQIKRLITAMKLTSCSRINLLENKALLVGDDLTEGEAQVLAQYGWIPDTGLGSMLNYCDRVFHDRKNVKDSSEWRSKIGKLLMDGYNGGTVVLTDIPKKVMEYTATLTPHIKFEL